MIDPNSSLPLYQQISASIETDISKGIYKPGERLPGEITLCEQFGVSRVTLRHAIADLAENGFVVSKQGKGTYVSLSKTVSGKKDTDRPFKIDTFYRVTNKLTELVEKGEKVPDKELFDYYDFDETVLPYICRIRKTSDKPAIIETDYLFGKTKECLFKDTVNRSLLNIIEADLGIEIFTFEDSIGAVTADQRIAKLLNVPVGTPLVRVVEKVYTP